MYVPASAVAALFPAAFTLYGPRRMSTLVGNATFSKVALGFAIFGLLIGLFVTIHYGRPTFPDL
jgi:hypothetical protein